MMRRAELINETIAILGERPAVFSAADVAAHADLNGRDADIRRALQQNCDHQVILPLDVEDHEPLRERRYLGMVPAERWWLESTRRWAQAGVGQLSSAELCRAMSVAFDTRQWGAAPHALVNVGRRWAAVADGAYPDAFTLPWAILIHCNPQFGAGLRSLYDLGPSDCGAIIDDVLRSLTARESEIIKRRAGLGVGPAETLGQIGASHAVTRERIRQIEQKAWRKLAQPARQQSLRYAFAAEFMRTRGALLIDESAMTPVRKFLHKAVRLNAVRVPELGLHFVGPEAEVKSYRAALPAIDADDDLAAAAPYFRSLGLLRFLSQEDGERVNAAEQSYRANRVAKTRPRMLREALRSLGRAAHYGEIAAECYRLFPECGASVRSLHAALSAAAGPDKEQFGIVWIGRKGMYGLKEHGYSRPDTDLFDGVAQIVESLFRRTNRPVAQEAVIAEMSKQRRELHLNSVVMALSLNDRLQSVGQGEYIPRAATAKPWAAPAPGQYDIDAAFDAFVSAPDAAG